MDMRIVYYASITPAVDAETQKKMLAEFEQYNKLPPVLKVKGVAIDASVNKNRWKVEPEDLDYLVEEANKRIQNPLGGIQYRLDHSENVRNIIGKVNKYWREGDKVYYEAETDDPDIIRKILRNYIKFDSIQIDSSSAYCSYCLEELKAGKYKSEEEMIKKGLLRTRDENGVLMHLHQGAYEVVRKPKVREQSLVATPAYDSAITVPIGFSAAIDKLTEDHSYIELTPIDGQKIENISNKEEKAEKNITTAENVYIGDKKEKETETKPKLGEVSSDEPKNLGVGILAHRDNESDITTKAIERKGVFEMSESKAEEKVTLKADAVQNLSSQPEKSAPVDYEKLINAFTQALDKLSDVEGIQTKLEELSKKYEELVKKYEAKKEEEEEEEDEAKVKKEAKKRDEQPPEDSDEEEECPPKEEEDEEEAKKASTVGKGLISASPANPEKDKLVPDWFVELYKAHKKNVSPFRG